MPRQLGELPQLGDPPCARPAHQGRTEERPRRRPAPRSDVARRRWARSYPLQRRPVPHAKWLGLRSWSTATTLRRRKRRCCLQTRRLLRRQLGPRVESKGSSSRWPLSRVANPGGATSVGPWASATIAKRARRRPSSREDDDNRPQETERMASSTTHLGRQQAVRHGTTLNDGKPP